MRPTGALRDSERARAVDTVMRASLAGVYGNRTHPTRRSQVTLVLKTREATRLHPPPSSCQKDTESRCGYDLADLTRLRNARKIVGGAVWFDGDQKPTGCLRINEERPIDIGGRFPTDKVAQVMFVPFRAPGAHAGKPRLSGARKDGKFCQLEPQ